MVSERAPQCNSRVQRPDLERNPNAAQSISNAPGKRQAGEPQSTGQLRAGGRAAAPPRPTGALLRLVVLAALSGAHLVGSRTLARAACSRPGEGPRLAQLAPAGSAERQLGPLVAGLGAGPRTGRSKMLELAAEPPSSTTAAAAAPSGDQPALVSAAPEEFSLMAVAATAPASESPQSRQHKSAADEPASSTQSSASTQAAGGPAESPGPPTSASAGPQPPDGPNGTQASASPRLEAPKAPLARSEKLADVLRGLGAAEAPGELASVRVAGPTLFYSAGQLTSSAAGQLQAQQARLLQAHAANASAPAGLQARRPSLPPPVNQANAASGLRSPMSPSGALLGQPVAAAAEPATGAGASLYQASPPYASLPALAQLANRQQQPPTNGSSAPAPGRRPASITRVEHLSVDCANDLIKAVIVFNGSFRGIIYSSGYVNDPTCLYVNGSGATKYEFSIRMNQCGTLGRQELHQPTIAGEAKRRDHIMVNALSIQYNGIIEQEWDEHLRVSCEYGSDFWKTISFDPFNVESNTGPSLNFKINPPQCQMEVLLGHGIGPKILDGPVSIGDPLTLLIHMKSERAGYDILVKNCVAHNGGKQRFQLIDSNGCVVNDRFISPFRGTYNDNDQRHVTLYSYFKAFRFTGVPVMYVECEVHMCHNACPPQMCYWRRLSKRSVDNNDFEYTTERNAQQSAHHRDHPWAGSNESLADLADQSLLSNSLNLFKAIQVRPDRSDPEQASQRLYGGAAEDEPLIVCYSHLGVLVFVTTMVSLLVLVLSVALTCFWRIRTLTRTQMKHSQAGKRSRPSTAPWIPYTSFSPSLLSICQPGAGCCQSIESAASSPSSATTAASLCSARAVSSPQQPNLKPTTATKTSSTDSTTKLTSAITRFAGCPAVVTFKGSSLSLVEQLGANTDATPNEQLSFNKSNSSGHQLAAKRMSNSYYYYQNPIERGRRSSDVQPPFRPHH